MVHQRQPSPTGAPRQLLAGSLEQLLVGADGIRRTEHLGDREATARARLAVRHPLMTALQTHPGDRGKPGPQRRDNQRPLLAPRALPGDGEGGFALRLEGHDGVTDALNLAPGAVVRFIRDRRPRVLALTLLPNAWCSAAGTVAPQSPPAP